MKKQFTKIKIAAENLSRSNKTDCKDFELEIIEKQVEKYRDTIEKILRKLPAISSGSNNKGESNGGFNSNNTNEEIDKRIKKNTHYKIGQALDESSKELSKDMPLHIVLASCGELEKSIAECIIENELETENRVVRRLKNILDKEIQEISTLKRSVSRTLQEYTSLKRSYEAAIRLDEPPSKITHIKGQQEECKVKLEKERDIWAAQMFELIAKEDEIVNCIRDYVLNQRNYHERALQRVNASLARIQDTIQATEKSRFGTSLKEHLVSTHREISYVIELCVCCLIEHGLCEEGLLRLGCASTKLRRMKHALEAQHVKTPLPVEYQDPHMISCILKLYLRELPEPLLTYTYYKDFIRIAELSSETERKSEIKSILEKLPAENYANLRYLTRFLWLVTQNVDQNKMSSHNLAIVMSPNMLWPRMDKSSPAADYLGQVNSSSASNVIVEMLITHWDYFFDGQQVDFFVTLQRHRLFVERKSKSNSSNEHLDRHDNEVSDSPRYGTIRRQKAYAPSPPTTSKGTSDSANANATNGGGSSNSSSGGGAGGDSSRHIHVKELFPQQIIDKPEKPPVPKLPAELNQQQQQQQQQQVIVNLQESTPTTMTSTTLPQPPPPPVLTPKPVPMTRTQFFGLDNLPSPTADRKSNDSINSLTFKPDLPQKPKIPKRPMVLGLGGSATMVTNKSDDDLTPTMQTSQPSQIFDNGSSGGFVRITTEKFIEKLKQENCDNNGMISSRTGHSRNSSNSSNSNNMTITASNVVNKENNQNNQQQQLVMVEGSEQQQRQQQQININSGVTAVAGGGGGGGGGVGGLTTTTTLTTSNNSTQPPPQQQQQQQQQQQHKTLTPTTPISPNMFHTPKRPTVPAPPPPINSSAVKKQSD